MNKLEEQKLNALAEFAAGAGHELNNPLAIIAGRAQMLLREIDKPEHRRQLNMITEQVQRACGIIADIRFFARPPQPEISRFNLADELTRLAEEHRKIIREDDMNKGIIQLITDFETADAVVKSDPALLHMAGAMLLNNARESVRTTGGTIRLRLRKKVRRRRAGENPRSRSAAVWQITVEDSGAGVPEEMRPLIFDPFYSGRQYGRGLGFGLPKVWRIMQILGGKVHFSPPAVFTLEVGTYLKRNIAN